MFCTKTCSVLFLFCITPQTFAFLPTKLAGDNNLTFTHNDITTLGLQQAISNFLLDQHLVKSNSSNVIDDFFGSDNDRKKAFYGKISEVISACNELQRNKYKEAKYSVNGEQIDQAHLYVVRTRTDIKILLKQNLTDLTIHLILEKMGQCLYVIQSFYSNTNWVEMFGNQTYPDFGYEGRTLKPTAPHDTSTCRSCRDTSTSMSINPCKDNIINNGYLTSGYRSGQDIYKVQLQGSAEGKCSHGDPNDNSSFIPATGGINKETPDFNYSPHAHLHQQAAEAAIAATVEFLTDKSRGIISYMGEMDKFKTLFGLHPRRANKSLAFSIDVSGSMAPEIAGVKKNVIDMITNAMSSDNEPENYVLAVFNDPESLTKGWKSTDGNEIQQRVQGIVVGGGGDCPEYSLSGILKAIELSLRGSSVYHCTDADAKDCNRVNEVMNAANAKNIKLHFLLTGSCVGFICGGRTKRMAKDMYAKTNGLHDYNSSRSMFDILASATGGTVRDTTKHDIVNVIHGLIKEDFPSSHVVVDSFNVPISYGNYMPVDVYADADMQVMKIEITGPMSDSEVILKDPMGKTLSVGGFVSRFYDSQKAILSIQRPKAGRWTIERTKSKYWQVNVTAEAKVDASFHFIEKDDNGFPHEIHGNPVAGTKYTLEIDIDNLPGNPIFTEIIILDDERSIISNFTTNLLDTHSGKKARLSMIMPSKAFRIQLRCLFQNSSWSLRRTSKVLITPVAVRLSLEKIYDDVVVGVKHELPYVIMNTGASNVTLTVKYSDEKGYYHSVANSQDHVLSPGERRRGAFYITGLHNAELVKYTISVFKRGSNEILQSSKETIVFTSVVHPKCNVASTNGNCSFLASTMDCTKHTWNTSVSVSFSGVNLHSIFLGNANSEVKLKHNNLVDASSPLRVHISGTCCTPSVILNVRDTSNFVESCTLRFDDSRIVQQPTIEKTSTYEGYKASISVGAIAGIVAGAVVLLITVIAIVHIVMHVRTKSIKNIQAINHKERPNTEVIWHST